MRDSTGKKIKVTKYKTLKCRVIETRQFKQAHLEGVVEYIDTERGVTFLSEPVVADQIFENFCTTAEGDLKILPKEKREKLKSRFVPFPSNMDMLYDAGNGLKQAIGDVILDNRVILIKKY